MGKKMKLRFLSKNPSNSSSPSSSSSSSSSSWSWPSCTQTKTLSFRTNSHEMFKTINSTYLDKTTLEGYEPPDSFFTNSSESASFSSTSEYCIAPGGCDPIEAAIQGIKSERLFFEPGVTSSILAKESNKSETTLVEYESRLFKEGSLVLSMESKDPYLDFKKSMEEMVEANGLKDWEELEELFSWYLKANEKNNHGFIIGAFVDLLVGVAFKSYNNHLCTCCNSPSSPLSFCCNSSCNSSSFPSTPNCVSSIEAEDENETSPCLSSLLEEEEEEDDDDEIIKEDDASS